VAAKYAGYARRQERQIERFRALEDKRIPVGFDFTTVPGLRFEARERLAAVRPVSLGQAGRVTGISPADITVLWVALHRHVRP
jgi:tRNA uridine 5-carboxymethylaminomethyl modification enzyme